MNIIYICNVIQIIYYVGKRFFIDLMLVDKGVWLGFLGIVCSELCNLLVELLFFCDKIVDVDVVIVIYIYDDYWDVVVIVVILKILLVFVQYEVDVVLLCSQGFQDLCLLLVDSEFVGVCLQKIIFG